MAKRVVLSTVVTLGGVDYSDQISKADLTIDSESQDVTNMTSAGWHEFLSGLLKGTLALEFKKASDLSGLDLAIWTAMTTRALVPFSVKGINAATSASNPIYSGYVVISQWQPIQGSPGEAFSGSVSWDTSGAITRATA